MRRRGTVLLALSCALGCAKVTSEPHARNERYGVFRDLLLVPRGDARGGAFFLDRFETTNGDWHAWLRRRGVAPSAAVLSLWGADEPGLALRDLPVARVTLGEAERFARWRFCRLPRFDEWQHAATAGGEYRFPWGDRPQSAWSNTGDLGVQRAMAVGTLESGRQSGGAYDLLGNVAEWTSSLSARTQQEIALLELPRAPALACWRLPTPPPLLWLAQLRHGAPRLVVGGHFAIGRVPAPGDEPNADSFPLAWERAPSEWGDSTGVRLAADPEGLLAALLAEPALPAEPEVALVLAFLRDPAHRATLVRAWSRLRAAPAAPWRARLAAELGG